MGKVKGDYKLLYLNYVWRPKKLIYLIIINYN